MFQRITTVLVVGLMLLGMLAATALASGHQKNRKVEESGIDDAVVDDCGWESGGTVCEADTKKNPGGQTKDKWDNETTTTHKGNSGKVKDSYTCVWNPSGTKLMSWSPEDEETRQKCVDDGPTTP